VTRWASSTNSTEADQVSVVIVTLIELDFVGGIVRAHDGIGNLTHNGGIYYGVGTYAGVEGVADDIEVSPKGLTLTLSGIPGDMTPDILAETGYQNRRCTLYIGLLNRGTNAWIDTPETLWEGFMDYMEVSGSEGQLKITLHVEDELRREPPMAWYTDEEQQARYPGDRFFSDLANIQSYRATWGQAQIGADGGFTTPRGRGPVRPYMQ
jgi:hypothetical protein